MQIEAAIQPYILEDGHRTQKKTNVGRYDNDLADLSISFSVPRLLNSGNFHTRMLPRWRLGRQQTLMNHILDILIHIGTVYV